MSVLDLTITEACTIANLLLGPTLICFGFVSEFSLLCAAGGVAYGAGMFGVFAILVEKKKLES